MDFGTIIIGLICIILCALPIILTNRNRKKQKKQLLQSLTELAKERNCEITQHEICGDFAIALDESSNFVFFEFKDKDQIKQQTIDLSTIGTCKVNTISRATYNNDKVIEQLNLHLSPKDKSKAMSVLEFYKTDLSSHLSGEFQSIEKWNTLINAQLKLS